MPYSFWEGMISCRLLQSEKVRAHKAVDIKILLGTSSYVKKSSVSLLEDKKRRLESVHSFETQAPSANDRLAEEIMKVESKIIRYRLFIIYTTAVTRIKEMRLMAKALFNKMDDWVIYGIKAENDALYEQVGLLL